VETRDWLLASVGSMRARFHGAGSSPHLNSLSQAVSKSLGRLRAYTRPKPRSPVGGKAEGAPAKIVVTVLSTVEKKTRW